MRPFKEVILFDNISPVGGLAVTPTTNYRLKQNAVLVLWRGSIDKFKKDFEIPDDAPLSTKDTKLSNGNDATFVKNWDWTTLNFKFNYQIWYRDKISTNLNNIYVNGSNNTINLTIPNVLVFNGNQSSNDYITYFKNDNITARAYNPNLFPLPISVNDFIISNKVSDFNYISGNGIDRGCYLIFRYGVDGDDIQICLLTRDSGNLSVNNNSLIIPYASLTFTGFNKIKRL